MFFSYFSIFYSLNTHKQKFYWFLRDSLSLRDPYSPSFYFVLSSHQTATGAHYTHNLFLSLYSSVWVFVKKETRPRTMSLRIDTNIFHDQLEEKTETENEKWRERWMRRPGKNGVDSVMLSVRRENLAQTNQQWRIYWPSWIKSPEIQKASGMVLSGLWFCFSEILSSLPSSMWYCFHRIVSLLWQNAVKQNTGYMLLHLLLREREDHLQGSWGKNSSVWPCGCHDGQDKGRRWPSIKKREVSGWRQPCSHPISDI